MNPEERLDLSADLLRRLIDAAPPEAPYLRGAAIGLEFARDQMRHAVASATAPATAPVAPPKWQGVIIGFDSQIPAPEEAAPAPTAAPAPPRPRSYSPKWQEDRRAVLRRMYPAGAHTADIAAAVNALPGPPTSAPDCAAMAGYLGLRRPGPKPLPPPAQLPAGDAPLPYWTPERDDVVRRLWPLLGRYNTVEIIAHVNALPGARINSPSAVGKTAARLGLPATRLDAAEQAEAATAAGRAAAPQAEKTTPAPAPAPAATAPAPPAPDASQQHVTPPFPTPAEIRLRRANHMLDIGRSGLVIIQETGITEAELRQLNEHRRMTADAAMDLRQQKARDMLADKKAPDVVARSLRLPLHVVIRLQGEVRRAAKDAAA